MNLETKITIYKFTPQLFTLTQEKCTFMVFQPIYLLFINSFSWQSNYSAIEYT